MRAGTLALAAIVGALAATLGFQAYRRSGEPPVQPVGAAPATAGTPTQSASREVASETVPGEKAEARPLPARGDPAPPAAPPTGNAPLDQQDASDAGGIDLDLERAFDADAVDPLWAPGAEAAILSEMAQVPNLRAVTFDVQCKTKKCRIRWVLPRDMLQGRPPGDVVSVRAAGSNVPFSEETAARLGVSNSELIFSVDASGTPTAQMYLARRDEAEAPR